MYTFGLHSDPADRAEELFWQAIDYARERGVPVEQFEDDYVFYFHGMDHFLDVARSAGEIAAVTPGANFVGAVLAAAYHDLGRYHDNPDPEHGRRSAKIVKRYDLLVPWRSLINEKEVLDAIKYHTDGKVTTNPTMGSLWDADRLELHRVGILPDPRLMSTVEGKKRAQEWQ
jgi:uncharacterized protein